MRDVRDKQVSHVVDSARVVVTIKARVSSTDAPVMARRMRLRFTYTIKTKSRPVKASTSTTVSAQVMSMFG